LTYRVEIKQCLEQFHRAHKALIERFGGKRHLTPPPTMFMMEDNWYKLYSARWYKLYSARPVRRNSSWKYLDFKSERHYTLFVLKWS